MTYFEDLTPYKYFSSEKGILNIGWISANQSFQKGETPSGFTDALAMCANNPFNLCRGFHTCDICPRPYDSNNYFGGYELNGRKIGLGNGEIRVMGEDRVIYSAPTLIVHYVDIHRYLPPASFIEAVMKAASTMYVVYGDVLGKIQKLSTRQRYKVCLSIFEAASKKRKCPLGTNIILKLQKSERALDRELDNSARRHALTILEEVAPNHFREDTLHSIYYCVKWFLSYGAPSNELGKDELEVERVAMALEYGFKIGLSISVLENYIEDVLNHA